MDLYLFICLFVFPGQLIYVIKRNRFKIFSLASLKGRANKNIIRRLRKIHIFMWLALSLHSRWLKQSNTEWHKLRCDWCSQQLYDHMHVAKQSCVSWNDHKWLIELKSWAMCLLRFVSSPLLSAKESTAQFFSIVFCCVSAHKCITGSLTCEGWPFAIYLKCTESIDKHYAWTTLIFYFLVFSKFSCSIQDLKSCFSFLLFFLI